MNGFVYRFLDNKEEIIYVGSCEDIMQRLRQHFEYGHLSDLCYNEVLYVDYAEFKTRTEAYMYEQYEIALLKPEWNTNGKVAEAVELEYFCLTRKPVWKRLYAKSNYGYRYEKVYTNFTEEPSNMKESNRKYEMQDAVILNRFKKEMQRNIEILNNISILEEKCPTYLSLIDKVDLHLLQECMSNATVHFSLEYSIYPEAISDTNYDMICIDETIIKFIKQMKSTDVHQKCGILQIMDGDYEIDFPYTKTSSKAVWIPALCDESLQDMENKAIGMVHKTV